MLEQLELEVEDCAIQAELRARHLEHRRVADVRADDPLDSRNGLTRDIHEVVYKDAHHARLDRRARRESAMAPLRLPS
jgi:hypothetical protein